MANSDSSSYVAYIMESLDQSIKTLNTSEIQHFLHNDKYFTLILNAAHSKPNQPDPYILNVLVKLVSAHNLPLLRHILGDPSDSVATTLRQCLVQYHPGNPIMAALLTTTCNTGAGITDEKKDLDQHLYGILEFILDIAWEESNNNDSSNNRNNNAKFQKPSLATGKFWVDTQLRNGKRVKWNKFFTPYQWAKLSSWTQTASLLESYGAA